MFFFKFLNVCHQRFFVHVFFYFIMNIPFRLLYIPKFVCEFSTLGILWTNMFVMSIYFKNFFLNCRLFRQNHEIEMFIKIYFLLFMKSQSSSLIFVINHYHTIFNLFSSEIKCVLKNNSNLIVTTRVRFQCKIKHAFFKNLMKTSLIRFSYWSMFRSTAFIFFNQYFILVYNSRSV